MAHGPSSLQFGSWQLQQHQSNISLPLGCCNLPFSGLTQHGPMQNWVVGRGGFPGLASCLHFPSLSRFPLLCNIRPKLLGLLSRPSVFQLPPFPSALKIERSAPARTWHRVPFSTVCLLTLFKASASVLSCMLSIPLKWLHEAISLLSSKLFLITVPMKKLAEVRLLIVPRPLPISINPPVCPPASAVSYLLLYTLGAETLFLFCICVRHPAQGGSWSRMQCTGGTWMLR